MLNVGEGQFLDVARPVGCDGTRDGRGVGVADFDADGRLDWVVANNGAEPTFYLNRLPGSGHWLRLELRGRRGNRDAVGARVRLEAGGKTQTRWLRSGSGYASQSAYPLHFGLGETALPDTLEILWPGGTLQRLERQDLATRLQAGRVLRLREPIS
jgi:hypothetical protein